MHQCPFCVLLKKKTPPPPTALSLWRVGMYAKYIHIQHPDLWVSIIQTSFTYACMVTVIIALFLIIETIFTCPQMPSESDSVMA